MLPKQNKTHSPNILQHFCHISHVSDVLLSVRQHSWDVTRTLFLPLCKFFQWGKVYSYIWREAQDPLCSLAGIKMSLLLSSFSHLVLSDFPTPWTAAHQASLPFTFFWSLLKLTSIELMMPSDQRIFCCPLLLLPSIFSSIRVFSSGLALCIRWPKYWSFNFSISPSNEYSELISFGID